MAQPVAATARFRDSYDFTLASANSVVITREQFEERKRQWEAMNRWEREQPLIEYSPERALEALGALWQWIPSLPE